MPALEILTLVWKLYLSWRKIVGKFYWFADIWEFSCEIKKMGSGGKKKEQSGDVTIEGAPEAAEGPSYEEKLRLTF